MHGVQRQRVAGILAVVAFAIAVAVSASVGHAQRGGTPSGGAPGGGAVPAQQGPLEITIEQVSPNLYRAFVRAQIPSFTVFLVTPEGIILADPMNPEFAARLKSDLATRFPGRPVKWVIETHYHWDHGRGGAMFADTATFLGHENLRKNLRLPIAQAPPPGETTDLDGDNRIDRNEAQTGTRTRFDRFDTDRDGYLSQEELTVDVRWPDIVFKDEYTITLGGMHARAIWAKNRHSSDMIDVYFPEERALFAGDYVVGKQLWSSFSFDHRPITAWIASYRALVQLDFDTFVSSHQPSGSKADMVAHLGYLEELESQVSAGIKAGKTLEDLQKTITLDKYKDWPRYDQRLTLIQDAYNSLTKYAGR